MPRVTVYSRRRCHLCDVMLAELDRLRDEHAFELDVVDVDSAPELAQRYGRLVPVLALDGVELCHYHLDRVRLTAALGGQ